MKLSTIIQYIQKTPHNTNPTILRQMLEEYMNNPESETEEVEVGE